jgi:hypothetical protein
MTRIFKVYTYIYSREDSDSRHAAAEILQLARPCAVAIPARFAW